MTMTSRNDLEQNDNNHESNSRLDDSRIAAGLEAHPLCSMRDGVSVDYEIQSGKAAGRGRSIMWQPSAHLHGCTQLISHSHTQPVSGWQTMGPKGKELASPTVKMSSESNNHNKKTSTSVAKPDHSWPRLVFCCVCGKFLLVSCLSNLVLIKTDTGTTIHTHQHQPPKPCSFSHTTRRSEQPQPLSPTENNHDSLLLHSIARHYPCDQNHTTTNNDK